MNENDAAVFEKIVRNRRSVRAYLDKPVPRDLLEKIFALANQAPSNCNTQPWLTHVASGESIEKLRATLPELAMQGKMSLDFPYDVKQYTGVYKDRQFGAAKALYDACGIAREDKAGRMQVFLDNYKFFGAPHVAFIFLPEQFGLREAADVGMYAQTLMLAMTAYGLASVPQTALSFNADTVREVLGIEPNHKLLFGLSFGYEDKDAPVNRARTDRAALQDNTVFHD